MKKNAERAIGRGLGRRLFALTTAALICALVLLPAAAPSEAAVTAPNAVGDGYSAVLYDNTSGLPTSEANDILQAESGFILIGSYCGLIRFDGREFYRYDASTGVSSVNCLLGDSRGRVWIGTNDSGAAVLEDEQFTFYTRNHGLASSSVHALAEDPEGNVFLGTTMGIAYVDPEGTLHPLDNPQVNQAYVRSLVPDGNGVIYALTRSGDIFTIENRRVSGYYPAEDLSIASTVNSICPDPLQPGFVYLGTQGSDIIYGSLSRGMEGSRIYSVSPHKKVNQLTWHGGLLWICSDNGVGYFDESFRYTAFEGIPLTSSVDRMMVDYEGNLWFTSSRQGVMKIVENRFINVSRTAGLDSMVVNATCTYRGDLYIGTDDGLVILDGARKEKQTALSYHLSGVRIRCIMADSAGYLWLCTYGTNGLVRYDGDSGSWRTFNADKGMASNRVRCCMELSDGTLAVATTGGLNLLKDGAVTATYNNSRGISNLEILCLEETADGRLYLGSDGDGIYIVDGNKVSRLGLEDGLLSEVILRIRRDPAEEIYWIVTSNSIAYMIGDKITTVRNFPYSNNFDLCFDDDGKLWILSSNGVYVVTREDMLADGDIEYILYDNSCGLPCVATANGYSQLDADGTLYIAGSTGVCSVNINDDGTKYGEVRLSVPFLIVDDEYVSVPESGEIRLPASCRRLTIYPYAFTYSMNNPHVSYQLEGFDESPKVVTKQELDSVTYTNLDGGTYRFTLSQIDVTSGKVEQTTSVTIVKSKAIHEQIWFWVLLGLLAVLLVGGSVVLFFRKKTKDLERRNEENRHMIQDISGAFAKCIDMKDAYTNGHSTRVAHYTALLASRLGKSPEEADRIYNIALLHDIGKINIPDNILNKPGRLTDEEYQVMKSHSSRGYNILHDVSIAPELALGAGYHHEKYDGTGYPSGLKGDEIPQVAQIIAVADTFDAMYSTRPYRKKMALSAVADELRRIAGTQLNPEYVELFLKLIEEGEAEKIDREYTSAPAASAGGMAAG